MTHPVLMRALGGIVVLALASGAASSAHATVISESGHNCTPATRGDATMLVYSSQFGPYNDTPSNNPNGAALAKVICHLQNTDGVQMTHLDIKIYNRLTAPATKCAPMLLNHDGLTVWSGVERSGLNLTGIQTLSWDIPSAQGSLFVTCNIAPMNSATSAFSHITSLILTF